MKPLAMTANGPSLDHSLFSSGLVTPLHYVRCFPDDDIAGQMRGIVDYWLDHPTDIPALHIGWVGPEGFDINRFDSLGNLIGTTQGEFDRGMAGGGFRRERDTAACNTIASVCRTAGVWPKVIYINHEPESTPPHTEPLSVRARFNSLRMAHFKDMLSNATTKSFITRAASVLTNLLTPTTLYTAAESIVIDFVQFSSKPNPFAWDYNGVRVPFNPSRAKFRPSTQMYSTPDGMATIKLAAWLASNPPGSMPIIQPANWEMFLDQYDLCEQRNCTPIIYFDTRFGGGLWWQADQAEHALNKRNSNA